MTVTPGRAGITTGRPLRRTSDALRGLASFHRQLILAHGISAAGSPLSPAERRVLAQLLTDQSEKLIAANLGLSSSTVHGYVKSVLKKLGVKGRSGLVSLWLGKQIQTDS